MQDIFTINYLALIDNGEIERVDLKFSEERLAF
jgi:hypothetical protein